FALKSEFYRGEGKPQPLKYLTGCWVVAAHGREKLESVTLVRGTRREQIECDYLACGYHLVPNIELAELLGCEIDRGSVRVDEYQQTTIPNVYSVGEATGI